MSYLVSLGVIYHTELTGHRNLFATVTYFPSADLDKQIQDIMAREIQSLKKAPGFYPNLVIQPLYEAAIRSGKQRGGNAAGIDADGPLTGTYKPTSHGAAASQSRC